MYIIKIQQSRGLIDQILGWCLEEVQEERVTLNDFLKQ